MIKLILETPIEEILRFQNLDPDAKANDISYYFFLRIFLVVSCVLCGLFCGLTSSLWKIFATLVTLNPSMEFFLHTSSYVFASLVVVAVLCNFGTLNVTISLYS